MAYPQLKECFDWFHSISGKPSSQALLYYQSVLLQGSWVLYAFVLYVPKTKAFYSNFTIPIDFF